MDWILFWVVFALIALVTVIAKKNNEKAAVRLAQEEAERLRAEAERRMAEAERNRDAEQQSQYKNQILVINEDSIRAFEAMPVELEHAEKYLDQAAIDFAEGAFSPFWASVEKATLCLARFDESAGKIGKNSSTYVDLAKKYRSRAPAFSVSSDSTQRLKIAFETAKRMSEIVRKAQRSFEFSLIYEQIKTNKILVAGFNNLAHALEEMMWRITSSIDDLSSSVDRMSSTLNQSLQRISDQTERVAVGTAGYREDLAKESAGRGAREEKALEMLDNLQRKRYPSIIHGGLR